MTTDLSQTADELRELVRLCLHERDRTRLRSGLAEILRLARVGLEHEQRQREAGKCRPLNQGDRP